MTATVYRSERYLVGGELTHGGEEETHYPAMPADLVKVWDYDLDEWNREGDRWVPDGLDADEPMAWTWEEMLDEYGPVVDRPDHELIAECPHCLLELVDELHIAGHLP